MAAWIPPGDDEERVEAFAPSYVLEDFFAVSEGEPGFRWRSIIYDFRNGSSEEKTFFFRREDWTWAEYYKAVREWVRSVMGRKSPKGSSILSAKP